MKIKKKLICLMPNGKDYGFPDVVEGIVEKHAPVTGLFAFMRNDETGDIENCRLKSKDPAKAKAFMNEETVLAEHITQFIDGRLVPKTMYFAPYAPDEDVRQRPTVMELPDESIVTVEIILAEDDGLSRTFLYRMANHNLSLSEIVDGLFDTDLYADDRSGLVDEDELFTRVDETCDYEEGILVDYYSETGRRYDITYEDGEQIFEHVVSMRIVNINRN